MNYCKKHDRAYEDTSRCKFLPFYECVECKEEESRPAEDGNAVPDLGNSAEPVI